MVESAVSWVERAVGLKLQNDDILADKIHGVYDYVPSSASPPYVVINDIYDYQRDTLGESHNEFTYNIHVWSTARGNAETNDILNEIKRILHRQSLNNVPGNSSDYTSAMCIYEYSQVYEQGTAQTSYRHGVIRFRIFLTKN